MKAIVEIKGNPIEIEVPSCVAHTEGEFAGNVDLQVESSSFTQEEPVQATLQALHLRIPGCTQPAEVHGYHHDGQTLKLTFYSEELREEGKTPESLELLWGSEAFPQSLGSIPCTAAGGVPGQIQSEIRSGLNIASKSKAAKATEDIVNRVLAALIGLFLTAGFAWAAWKLAGQVWEGMMAYTWPEAMGSIIRCKLEQKVTSRADDFSRDSGGRTTPQVSHKLNVEVSFIIPGESAGAAAPETGKEYRTNRYNAASAMGLSVPSAAPVEYRDVLRMQPVRVRYDPSDPARSMIRPGLSIETAYLLLPLPALLAIVLVCWFRVLGRDWDDLGTSAKRVAKVFILWSLTLVIGLMVSPLLIFGWEKLLGSSPCGTLILLYALAMGVLCWRKFGT